VTGELLCQCGCRIVEWVHGHGQCQNCKRNVFPCCDGEVAQVSEVGSFAYRLNRCMNEIDWDIATGRIQASFYDVRLGRIETSIADGLPGAAGNDFAYSDRNYPAVQNIAWQAEPSFGSNVRMGTEMPVVLARPCPCSGLLDLAYCGICGTANICESEPDVDDLVKAA
jgi:hypothetical protein